MLRKIVVTVLIGIGLFLLYLPAIVGVIVGPDPSDEGVTPPARHWIDW